MRKFVTLLLAGVLTLGVASCGPEDVQKFCRAADITFNAVDAYDKYTQLSDKDKADWDRRYINAKDFCARYGYQL